MSNIWQILSKRERKTKPFSSDDIISILLKNRGLTKEEEIRQFLNPKLEDVTLDNLSIDERELGKAVSRIKKAIDKRESIVVYTDYDVDGVCGGAILWETLYKLGAKVMPYIPQRVKEGYGLSKKGLDFVKSEYKTTLVITVDCGISQSGEVKYAKSLGIETIVLDHHLLPKRLPQTVAIVHTTSLAASGIAWLFSNFLIKRLNSSQLTFLKENLDLAALATIADLVPLQGHNRTLVFYGLREINQTKRLGLKELIKQSGLTYGNISAREVGYIIAPRINASGRLEHAMDALRLMLTRDKQRALTLARKLNIVNRQRQMLTNKTVKHALAIVEDELYISRIRKKTKKLIFVGDKSYNQGIIGLIAGKLVDTFNLPSIVLSIDSKHSKASARSVDGFNIVDVIKKASDLLVDVGGHPLACGFTVETKNIEKLKKRLTKAVNSILEGKKLKKVIKIDMELNLTEINKEIYYSLCQLSPFGVGNPEPVFITRSVQIINAARVGKSKDHLKLKLRQGSNWVFNAIGFNMGKLYWKLTAESKLDVAYTIEEDSWNNNSTLQLKLKDVIIQ